MTDKRRRILQICHDFKGPFAAVARQYAGSFADCEVRTVFLRGGESASLMSSIAGEVEFLNLEPGSLRGLKLEPAKRLQALIGDWTPDILIAHRYKPLFLALLLSRQMEIPLVLGVMHEYGFLKRPGRALLSRFWPENIELIGVSQPVCDEIRHERPHLADRVHYVPLSIEAPTLQDSVTARHDLGVPLGSFCFGHIGRLVAKKNQKELLQAFARLEGDDVLALVGDGALKLELAELAKKLRVSERVIIAGHRDDARRLLKAFDAFVMTSTHEEAFGMVLLEAMAASLPIVTSNAPGPASIVGNHALLYKSGDIDGLVVQMQAVKQLSAEARQAMTDGALERLRDEFSIQSVVQRLRDIPGVREVAPVTI